MRLAQSSRPSTPLSKLGGAGRWGTGLPGLLTRYSGTMEFTFGGSGWMRPVFLVLGGWCQLLGWRRRGKPLLGLGAGLRVMLGWLGCGI